MFKNTLKSTAIALALLASAVSAQAGNVNPSSHYTHGYYRHGGTYVQPYHATNPNSTRTDNYSTRGNVNPWTGRPGSH
jgi:hypothetical protein